MESMTLNHTATGAYPMFGADDPRPVDHAQELRAEAAAVKVSFTWLGTRKALNSDQMETVANNFEAERGSLSAGKKLLNTQHPAFKALTAIRNQILQHWKGVTLPFPEDGIRLIPRRDVADFEAQMESYRADLETAVAELDRHYDDMREEARRRLGTLYNPSDYPATLDGLFSVSWEFPNVEPPSYLMRLAPESYERERQRVAGRFEEAVQLAEGAFIEQLNQLVTHLCDKLTPKEGGESKVFRDSAVHNLTEFFGTFQRLNIRSNDQLDSLVKQAQDAVRGISPDRLRRSVDLKEHTAEALKNVAEQLEGLMVARPRRKIIRPATATATAPTTNGHQPEQTEGGEAL